MAKRAMTDEAKALKVEAILNKVEEMFLVHDYDEIKMKDIAKAMDISYGILFVYFKSKETLFFNLLMRKYANRIKEINNILSNRKICSFEDVKRFVLDEFEMILNDACYVKLESLRGIILEKNTDSGLILNWKLKIHNMVRNISNLMNYNEISEADIFRLFHIEMVILVGSIATTAPSNVAKIIEEHHLKGFIHDSKKDALFAMECFLDGYEKKRGNNKGD